MNAVHYSSATCEWETPWALFKRLDAEFGFTLDVCANVANAKCLNFFSSEQDGLQQKWSGVCWCNPPYGGKNRSIGPWIVKALHSAWQGEATTVLLIPAKTDTHWWHDHVLQAHEIRFVRSRLRFNGCGVNAPFPSAIVIVRTHQRSNGSPDVRWWTPTKAERGAA